MIHEIQHTAQQHNNNSSISEGYGMSQNHHFECPQATFESELADSIVQRCLEIIGSLPRKKISAYTSMIPFCFFSNFTARSSIFGSSTLNDALDDKFWMLNFRRILLN